MNAGGTKHKGMTLIETLVVVMITSIMLAVSLTFYFTAQTDSQTKECQANMQSIANAEQQYYYKSSPHAYTTVMSNLTPEIPADPKCPSGGTYTVTISDGTATAQNGQTVPAGGIVISCSTSGHGKYAPGVDTPQ